MSYLIVGLGNPGEEYERTRHNLGRNVAKLLAASHQLSAFVYDKKTNSLIAKGKIDKIPVTVMLPETMMNNSGKAVVSLVKNAKQAEKLLVIYDDLDLPLGALKISFNRGDGGHRGLASIIKYLKTRAFVRVRAGICPTTPSGKLKKPLTEKQVIDFILGDFKPAEEVAIKKVIKNAAEAALDIVTLGREQAANRWNSK